MWYNKNIVKHKRPYNYVGGSVLHERLGHLAALVLCPADKAGYGASPAGAAG